MNLKMGVIAIVAVGLMVVSGLAMASPPVPPPMEGFGITSTVDVEMLAGDFVENEAFVWTWGANMGPFDNDGFVDTTLGFPGRPQFLDDWGRVAQIRYTEELNSIDTDFFQFNKAFVAASHDEPNLDVDKIYGWDDDETSLITSVSNSERVGLSIVAAGDDAGLDDMPSLCPWAAGTTIPATNEFIAMGSDSAAGLGGVMLAETHTDVRATVAPAMDHSISAEGVGMAQALVRVSLMEGDERFNPNEQGLPPESTPDLVSVTDFFEKTTAVGVIDEFTKGMHYHSTIPVWQMPEPWYQLQ